MESQFIQARITYYRNIPLLNIQITDHKSENAHEQRAKPTARKYWRRRKYVQVSRSPPLTIQAARLFFVTETIIICGIINSVVGADNSPPPPKPDCSDECRPWARHLVWYGGFYSEIPSIRILKRAKWAARAAQTA